MCTATADHSACNNDVESPSHTHTHTASPSTLSPSTSTSPPPPTFNRQSSQDSEGTGVASTLSSTSDGRVRTSLEKGKPGNEARH